MKNIELLCIAILIFTLAGCSSKPSLKKLKKYAAIETYPDDSFLDTVSQKRALVVVAHDDDDCAMSGTIAKLTRQGWEIRQLSLTEHVTPGTGKNPASIICQGNVPILNDFEYRRGLDTMRTPYMPIPYREIERQFLTGKVEQALLEKIEAFQPTVIFTLDDVKGGYGHPEHIFISRLVLDLFRNRGLAAQKIYQSVYTDHMEAEIVDIRLSKKLKKWGYPNASAMANKMYGIDGMPQPDVQINIENEAVTKMRYLRAYPEEARRNIRKFIPYYEEFDDTVYFSVFDREFFRVIEK